jgi:hypothetical protein
MLLAAPLVFHGRPIDRPAAAPQQEPAEKPGDRKNSVQDKKNSRHLEGEMSTGDQRCHAGAEQEGKPRDQE